MNAILSILPAAFAIFSLAFNYNFKSTFAFTGDDVYDEGIILQNSYASLILAIALYIYSRFYNNLEPVQHIVNRKLIINQPVFCTTLFFLALFILCSFLSNVHSLLDE